MTAEVPEGGIHVEVEDIQAAPPGVREYLLGLESKRRDRTQRPHPSKLHALSTRSTGDPEPLAALASMQETLDQLAQSIQSSQSLQPRRSPHRTQNAPPPDFSSQLAALRRNISLVLELFGGRQSVRSEDGPAEALPKHNREEENARSRSDAINSTELEGTARKQLSLSFGSREQHTDSARPPEPTDPIHARERDDDRIGDPSTNLQWSLPEIPQVEVPTAEAWQDFSSFYSRISTTHEAAGFALVRIPSFRTERSAGEVRPQILESSCQALDEKSPTVRRLRSTTISHNPPVVWRMDLAPAGDQDAHSAFDKWWKNFGAGTSLPQHATVNTNDPESRARCCLPEKSPVYPLKGNVLLERAPSAQGYTIPDAYLSKGWGTVFKAHIEELGMPAVNCLHHGHPKLWFVVPRDQYQKLKDVLNRDELAVEKRSSCHQYIGHEGLFLHPAYLEANGITYSCFLQPAGTAVVLLERAVHWGFNLGPNAAEAANYVPLGWVPPKDKECGCNPWTPFSRTTLLPPDTSPPEPRKQSRPVAPGKRKNDRAVSGPKAKKRKVPNRSHADSTAASESTKAAGLPMKLRDYILGGEGIASFMDIVRSSRTQETKSLRIQGGQRHVEADRLARTFRQRIPLDMYRSRLMQLQLLKEIDSRKQHRLSRQMVKDILNARQVEVDKESRKSLQKELLQYRRLREICSGDFDGLLPHLPYYSNEFLKVITTDDITALHTSLGHRAVAICKVGRKLNEAFLEDKSFPICAWETLSPAKLRRLRAGVLVRELDDQDV